jgi:hypothetical protein
VKKLIKTITIVVLSLALGLIIPFISTLHSSCSKEIVPNISLSVPNECCGEYREQYGWPIPIYYDTKGMITGLNACRLDIIPENDEFLLLNYIIYTGSIFIILLLIGIRIIFNWPKRKNKE